MTLFVAFGCLGSLFLLLVALLIPLLYVSVAFLYSFWSFLSSSCRSFVAESSCCFILSFSLSLVSLSPPYCSSDALDSFFWPFGLLICLSDRLCLSFFLCCSSWCPVDSFCSSWRSCLFFLIFVIVHLASLLILIYIILSLQNAAHSYVYPWG